MIFGGKKVPEMMRGLGQGVKEFKKGMKDGDDMPSTDNEVKPTNEEDVNSLYYAINKLNERAREIVIMRFGLFDHEMLTQKEVADMLRHFSKLYI